jgi:hypothetical protein
MYAEKEAIMHPEKNLSRVQGSFMGSTLEILIPAGKRRFDPEHGWQGF